MKLTSLLRGRLSTLRWRLRITLWLSAISAGLIVVGFAKTAEHALHLFFSLVEGRPWLPFLMTPVLGMGIVWLTQRFFPGSQGSGIPQVIAAIQLESQNKPVNTLVSLRIAFGKMVLGVAALFGGFSAGREGPSVQVAASILHSFHRFLPHARAVRAEDLILAGGAAGIAAAFNTPLAGITFAIEELGRRLEARTSGVLLSTIILCGIVSIAMMGNYNYFGHFTVGEMSTKIVVPVIIAGLACGLLGGAFSWLLLWPQKYPHASIWRWRMRRPIAFAGICGFLIAVIGFLSGGTSYGSGYTITSHFVAGDTTLPWYTAIARFLATVVSYYSGIPGGIFAPALAVGGALSANLASLFGMATVPGPLIALCMAGFLAAVTQSPITSAIIVMEMIDGHGMVISLMAVAVIAKAVSSRLSPELYQQLASGFYEQAERQYEDKQKKQREKQAQEKPAPEKQEANPAAS